LTSCDPLQIGIVVDTFSNSLGCDSLVTTVTTLLSGDLSTINLTTCDPLQAGTTVDSLSNTNGCDSVVTTITTLLTSDALTINATTCDPLQAGTSVDSLTNSAGCDSIVTTNTTLDPGGVVEAGFDQNICPGDSVLLTASGANSYMWSPAAGLSATNMAAVYAAPGSSTDYIVTGTTGGCIATDTVRVTVYSMPSLSAGTDRSVCRGDSTVLFGSGGAAYEWDQGVINGVAFIPVATSTYMMTGLDSNGCQHINYVTVIVNDLPVVDAGEDLEVCEGTAATLNGAGAQTYTWSGGIVNGTSFIPSASSEYIVTGSDTNSCVNTDTVQIAIESSVISNFNDLACDGSLYLWPDGTSSVIAASDAGPHQFVMGMTSSGCDSIVQVDLTVSPSLSSSHSPTICSGDFYTLPDGQVTSDAGTYQHIVTGGSGCDSTITTILSVVIGTPPANTHNDTIICIESGLLTIDVSDYPGIQFDWNNGDEGSVIDVYQQGTYIVTVTENSGCQYRDTIIVQLDVCVIPCQVMAPTAFTPDGDQSNDQFMIFKGCEEPFIHFDFRVYNRWGQLVFETNDPSAGWDGFFHQTPSPLDVYTFYVSYQIEGEELRDNITGVVTLMR
jgi:gliding motility-associated-like protein